MKAKEIRTKKYAYRLTILYFIAAVAFLFFQISQSLLLLLKGIQAGQLTGNYVNPGTVFGVEILLLGLTVFVTLANWEQSFVISTKGINFQVFFFWWVFVPWKQITGLQKSWAFWGGVQLIKTKKLTPFHRIMGIVYGPTFAPSFVYWIGLKGNKEVTSFLRRKLG